MGFGSRLKSSFVGALFGLLLIPGSIVLHAWNEYRTIHRSRGLEEAAGVVQTISDPDLLAEEMNTTLVHLSGFADTEEVLQDELFGIRERAIHLSRNVEMYQWVEEEEENSEGHKHYEYHRQWHPNRVNSSGFHNSGYSNPPLKFSSKHLTADTARVGAYTLNQVLKGYMDNWQSIELNEAAILETLGADSDQQFKVEDKYLYWAVNGPQPSSPEIGDIRMRFQVVLPSDVSLVAKLTGNTFDEYTTSNGEGVQRLYVGKFSAEEVMQKLMTENIIMAWVLRFAGLVMCVIGFTAILKPIAALVSWIPILGDVTGFALFVVGAALATIVSLVTISISWIAVRPMLAVVLLVLVSMLAYLIYRLTRSSSEPPVLSPN